VPVHDLEDKVQPPSSSDDRWLHTYDKNTSNSFSSEKVLVNVKDNSDTKTLETSTLWLTDKLAALILSIITT